jgi:hypothetical protein
MLYTSGLAAFEAGMGPAGHDPENVPSTAAAQAAISAAYFDPFDRVYRMNADKSLVAGSGPIQRAAHLLLPLGALPATPFSGLDIQAIRRATETQRQFVVETELRIAWKVLLDALQISMGKVTIEASRPWSGRFFVDVVDLATEESALLSNMP